MSSIMFALGAICGTIIGTAIVLYEQRKKHHQELIDTLNALGTMLGEWYEDSTD